MLPSDESRRARLEVRAADLAAEIFISDANFRLADRGIGRMESTLAPGIYGVTVRVGFEMREAQVILRPGADVLQEFGPLAFASPAPLKETAKTHEYHEQAAYDQSRRIHVAAGQGSTIFVLVRDWTARGQGADPPGSRTLSPAQGLTLRSAVGEVIADLGVASTSNLTGDAWAACNVSVNPGSYRLRLETPSGLAMEQTVVASAGWQTQVFLLQRPYGPNPDDRRADLSGGSILMADGIGFDPARADLRLAELARLGLVNNRNVLSSELRDMLTRKFENPMLGIFAAHLLHRAAQPDTALLQTVIGNLRGLLGDAHPDVAALMLGPAGGGASPSFQVPPMLRRSWSLVLDASVPQPEIVPAGSLAGRVAGRFWDGAPWLLWLSPDTPLGVQPGVPPDDAEDDLGIEALKTLLRQLQQQRRDAPARSAMDISDAESPEAGVAGYAADSDEQPAVAAAVLERPAAVSLSVRDVRPAITDSVMTGLVQTLGVPRGNVEALLDRLEQSEGAPAVEDVTGRGRDLESGIEGHAVSENVQGAG